MQQVESYINDIAQFMAENIDELLPSHAFKEVIKYSVFPSGKLFRPMLIMSLAQDLGQIKTEHKFLAMSIELHHTYTLIHDDLPAMDDDDFRRGRPSSHKKFSEWEAILAGDSLLNISYEVLAKLPANYLGKVLKIYTEAMGARGLILGQVKDLNNENQRFEDILELHRLKTGELIQLSLCTAAILSDKEELCFDLKQLGYSLGENFQLIDDLCELTDEINSHEFDVNPFLRFSPDICLDKIKENSKQVSSICKQYHLENLNIYIQSYTNKMKKKILDNIEKVNTFIKVTSKEIEDLS